MAPPVKATASTIKAYAVPLILFALALYYQLTVLPRSFPPSHYDILGIERFGSIEEVRDAYEKLSSKWNSGEEVPSTADFLKIRYAYELLIHPLWKRDYDIYGIDEQLHVLDKVREKHGGNSYSHIDLPLLDAAAASDHGGYAFNVITSKDFPSIFKDSKPWLIQVYSDGSYHCAQFSNAWKRIAALLEGIANTGMVELGEVQLATYLAERKPTGQFFFRGGLPSFVAFPVGCKTSDCVIRFDGQLSVDAVTDWFATVILNLPRIFYYTKESLGKDFLAKSAPHKVKVILFSKTGERASPFVRKISKDYQAYASFAFILWREEESTFWWNTFEVDSAPAIVFLKDPGVKPVVYHGSFNNSWFSEVIEQNKEQELPQLRSVTSMELGCDARGYSRAGSDTKIWYCIILAGRQSPELNKMRELLAFVMTLVLLPVWKSNYRTEDRSLCESKALQRMAANNWSLYLVFFLNYFTSFMFTLLLKNWLHARDNKITMKTIRRVQEILSNNGESDAAEADQSLAPSIIAFRNKRLTFAWLDGEVQDRYCSFYLFSETIFETCGRRRDMTDVPRIFIVRYKRNDTEDNIKTEKKPQNIWSALQDVEVDPASQLVVRYNGSNEIPQITKWVSEIINDGDSKDLPFYRAKTPELVPEDADPVWSKGAKSILSKSVGMKHRMHNVVDRCYGYLGDPRIGPSLLLAALLSFGTIWLVRSQQVAHSGQSGEPSESSTEDKTRRRQKERARSSKKDQPSSITDMEPKDAYQAPLSDSDTE